MSRGTLIAVALLTAYIGFEAYAIRAASERTKPAYIHKLLVEAQSATELCNSDALELRPRFRKTLLRATDNYRRYLSENRPELSPEGIENLLQQKVSDANSRVAAAIEAEGCTDAAARAHFQRYRIYARKTR